MRGITRLRAMWRYAHSPERTLRLLVPIVSAIPVAVLFDAAGVVRTVEEPLTRVIAHRATTPKSRIAVAQITDEDFANIFGGRHPLNPEKLAGVIDALAALGPLAIAVDLDTSDPVYRKLGDRQWFTPERSGAEKRPVPVIWARRATYSELTKRFYTADALGGAGKPRTAVAAVLEDPDKVVRRYQRSFVTDREPMLALPLELLKAGGLLAPGKQDGERLINYYGHTSGRHRTHISAASAKAAAGNPKIAEEFADKVIVLGGDFRAVDEHETPLGWMRGDELVAHIAETDAGNAAPTQQTYLNLIVFFGACLIAICFETFGIRKAMLVSAGGMLAGFLVSLWYTHLTRDALLVGTVFFVIVCQQIYTKIKRILKDRQKAMDEQAEPAKAAV